ncbi:MAG: aryl-sulfate sulfotransferase [Candidatus Marinimicrobia bacterium]|nr:aryl-sulfate sulfotransferase [Candidatus Neomarinimicrobiota bacterium]
MTFQNDDKPIEILTYNSQLASNGITIFGSYYNNYSAAIDMNGNEVWNSGGINTFVFFNADENNNLFGGKILPEFNSSLIGCEYSINNEYLWSEPIGEEVLDGEAFIQHEIVKLPNGNYMGFVPIVEKHPIPTSEDFSSINSPFSWEEDYEDYIDNGISYDWKGEKIVEWDKDTGGIVWEWSAFDYFSLDDFDYLAGHWETAWDNHLPFDWIHFNALVYNEPENALYVSSRHLDRISKIDYSSKEIIWNLGIQWLGDEVISPDTLFSGQHGLQILPNGNIVTLDNGILSQFTTAGLTAPVSRAIELEIVEENNVYSANTIWSYTLPPELYGALSGNVQKLENGNYLINTIGNEDGAHSLEITENHETVWHCKYNLGNYDTGPLYRAMRLSSLYPMDDNTLEISQFASPKQFRIISNYPNPFNPLTHINYEISTYSEIHLGIYNVKGEIIDVIDSGYKTPGIYHAEWYGKDIPSGVYFLQLSNQIEKQTLKLILLK